MNLYRLIGSLFCLLSFSAVMLADETDYSKGIIWVNEVWYGHQNSTVNHLMPDDPDGNFWKYRIVQAENPGKELGCTNQYGALWNGRLYLIAKQEKDPGATITGGRITVCDAKTMKILHQQSLIDPSGAQCDGRGFVGVDTHKGYVSSSNGVWVFDLDNFNITGQVEGTSNPNAGGDNDKPNTDPTGSLYHGQCGMMVTAAGKVFVAHQQYGLLVVDPKIDAVIDVISMNVVAEGAGIGSVVKSKDGRLWCSIAKNLKGTGATYRALLCVDPATLDYEVIDTPEGMYPPSNSWYAWTPDPFIASSVENCLYWKGGPDSWFTGTKIYKFDCDKREQTLFIDLDKEGANWKLYGCALGIHPITDEIYMALYHEFSIPTYITRRYSPSGEKIRDYEMIMNYWFPSLPLFPEGNTGGQNGVTTASATPGNDFGTVYTLQGVIVKSDCRAGDREGLSPGVYIWRGGDGRSDKFLVR